MGLYKFTVITFYFIHAKADSRSNMTRDCSKKKYFFSRITHTWFGTK